METLWVDFETYYDNDYSLKKLQTDAYIKDDRFEVILVSVIREDEAPVWYSGTLLETAGWLHANFDWANSAVCCHNTLFDGFILDYHFGIRPKLWMDTLPMARQLLPYLPQHGLAHLAKHYKLKEKGTEVQNAIGVRRREFSPQGLHAYASYCIGDTEICRDLTRIMEPQIPAVDLVTMDMFIRMFTQPQFVGNVALLTQQYHTEVARKQELLDTAALQKDVVMSNEKFAEHLRSLGVEPPTKVSPTTGKTTYAFAKTDKDFVAMLDCGYTELEAAVAARLGVKTTIAETRVLRMTEMAKRGPLPVYLNYWGAKTTGRGSGGNQMNWQNMPARGPSAGIREGIEAPEGHTIVVGDSSNIELRVCMAAAGQLDVIHKLASGVDLYCDFASKLFGRVITKADKKERMLGKIAMLSLQYGAGWVKFKEMVRIQSGEILSDDSAMRIVNLYREVHGMVMELHNYCNDTVLSDIAQGCNLLPVDRNGWCITTHEGFGVHGQHGVKYHKLRRELITRPNGRQDNGWVYNMGREKVHIYGGKVVENLCQYVAGRIVMWQTARFNQRYPVALSVHDEAVAVVRNEDVADAKAYLEECLSMAPPWCRGTIPLACEVGEGKTYGDAK